MNARRLTTAAIPRSISGAVEKNKLSMDYRAGVYQVKITLFLVIFGGLHNTLLLTHLTSHNTLRALQLILSNPDDTGVFLYLKTKGKVRARIKA
jgi:hypothetical protein